jgi:hypothetical protein
MIATGARTAAKRMVRCMGRKLALSRSAGVSTLPVGLGGIPDDD